MWAIFLSLHIYNTYHPSQLTSSINHNDLVDVTQRVIREQTRQEQSLPHGVIGIDQMEYYQWLHLFVFYRWISSSQPASLEDCLEQSHYIFGIIFLRNFDLLTSFQAYIHLTDNSIPNQFFSTDESKKLIDFIPMILVCCNEKELHEKLKSDIHYSPSVLCFQRIASLNTQLKPLDNVEVIWDFLIIYGMQNIVFIEAAWIIILKEEILNGSYSNNTFPDWDPLVLIRKTIEVFKKTYEYCRNESADQTIKNKMHTLFANV
ncbi:hypothetical protein GPJ56_003487 [Histomonas meleagridis]|uniref:uncharacterized protein n=1 Tax=Histomonas meleagridis TaxID=135588 RepID=UPI00355A2267|nr:hypothetical protein GPJ56_003487 [Histomonas meleagridis]KAH0799179.1 hypothetical protein GO595_007976 [Histomonas meleagridis]